MDGRYGNTRRKGIYLLPNLVTTGGLFAGFYSIVASIDGNFHMAAWAIFAAMLLDGLDGRVARLTSTASEFGKEFDSLADMVSFGLAPAIVVYQWGVERLAEYGAVWGRLGWLAAFLYVAAAAFRLARFNSNVAQDRRFFQGLASPAAAAGVASMIWLATSYQGFEGLAALVAGVTITAVTGLLMMSRFAYVSFKDVNPGRRLRFAQLLLIPLVIIIIALEPPVTIFALFVVYAASGPGRLAVASPQQAPRLGYAMSAARERYLAEIGIPVWRLRDAAAAAASDAPASPPAARRPRRRSWRRGARRRKARTCGRSSRRPSAAARAARLHKGPHANGVRRRSARRAAVRDRRGAGCRRGPAGRAVRRPRGAAAERDVACDRLAALRRLHREHPEVPAAGESRSAARRVGVLHAVPVAADRARAAARAARRRPHRGAMVVADGYPDR